MRNVGHKIAPDVLKPAQACYIIQNDKRTDPALAATLEERIKSTSM